MKTFKSVLIIIIVLALTVAIMGATKTKEDREKEEQENFLEENLQIDSSSENLNEINTTN